MNKFGYFKTTDPMLPGLKFGNWGSRPYEYFWVACVEPLADKDVFDFGTGVPSEHNWHEFVRDQLGAKSYFGIDMDERLKAEEINEPNHKMICMNGTALQLESNSFDVITSISSFEHIDNFDDFNKVIMECHRILRPGGKMVLTLDEYHDHLRTDALAWNELEKARKRRGMTTANRSYGMSDFAEDIKDWFVPDLGDLTEIPVKKNADDSILFSQTYNDCVSYGVFTVRK